MCKSVIQFLAFSLSLLPLLLGIPACADGPLIPIGSMPGRRSLQAVGHGTAELSRAGNCDDLSGTLRERMTRGMESDIEANLEYALEIIRNPGTHCEPAPPPPSCGGFLGFGSCDMLYMASDRGAPPANGSAESYSTTNNQVAGVDEADLLKNDGQFIYLVAGDELVIMQAWPADETHVISRTPVAGVPQRLFVADGRALVFSETGGSTCGYSDYSNGSTLDGVGLHISVFDITDPTQPLLERETMFNGSFTSARRINDTIHVVVSLADLAPPQVAAWPFGEIPWNLCESETTEKEVRVAFAKIEQANRELIANTELLGALPSYVDIDYEQGQSVTPGLEATVDCESVLLPDNTYASGFLSVFSFPIGDDSILNATTVLGNSGTVYASAENLYVAFAEQHGWSSDMRTVIHKFSLSATQAAEYGGTGRVPGALINQFAMDEHDGYLRIATTEGHIPTSSSNLFVLGKNLLGEDGLSVVGQVRGIAPTEDIRSIRFAGDRGFMVTFKKTDPLFTFDLSFPNAPMIIGELKIPGFSTYMHFLDDDHLLTIGFDADDQGSFAWFQGILLQIFDVSDMTHPILLHREVIGSRGSSSDATADHLAFTYFGDILALPIDICEGGSGDGSYGDMLTFSGLMLFRVSAQTGFTLLGGVDHLSDQTGDYGCGNWWTNANSTVKRSLFLEDFVYSLSSGQLKVNALDELDVDLVEVSLPPLNDSIAGSCYY